MIVLAVGPSNVGKTHYVREYVVPTLLRNPSEITNAAPKRFGVCLIDDPPTRRAPRGQYDVGARYVDTAHWRRAPVKARVSAFNRADPESLARLAYERGDAIIVLDEIDIKMGSGRRLGPWLTKVVETGRHDGIALVGTMRRLHAVRPLVRANCQFFLFGNLSDPEDRKYAAKTASVPEADLAGLEPRVFLEYRRETGERYLTTLRGSNRVVLARL